MISIFAGLHQHQRVEEVKIVVQLNRCSSGTYYGYTIGGYFTAWYVFVPAQGGDTSVEQLDADILITSEPPVENHVPGNYHDCFHSKVSGSLTRKVKIPGSSDDDLYRGLPLLVVGRTSSATREWHRSATEYERITVIPRKTEGDRLVWLEVDVAAYRLRNGAWAYLGGSHGYGRYTASTAPIQVKEDPGSGLPDLSLSRSDCKSLWERADRTVSFGDLVLTGVESVKKTDINTIAYVKDFIDLPSLGKTLFQDGVKLWDSVDELRSRLKISKDDIKSVLKPVSGLYLSNHYGTKLTASDTADMVASNAAVQESHYATQTVGARREFSLRHPSFGMVAMSRRLTARIHSYSDQQLEVVDSIAAAQDQLLSNVVRAGYEEDVLPTFENLWDLVPWSFAVDWFVPIGEGLSKLEDKHYAQTLRPRVVFLTQTADFEIDFVSLGGNWSGHLAYHVYDRSCDSAFPPINMHVDHPKGDASNHWVEAAALLITSV